MPDELTSRVKSTASGALNLLAFGLQTAARAAQQVASTLEPAASDEVSATRQRRADRSAATEGSGDLGPVDVPRPGGSETARGREADRATDREAGARAGGEGSEHPADLAVDPATEPVASAPLADTESPRRAATVVGELAQRPAQEVIAQVEQLSTDELRRLLEHEQAGKQRKTVIDAIERAVDAHQAR